MPAPVFIGDEVSAAGWRLAGLRVVVPEPGQEAAEVARLLTGKAELLLLSALLARNLPPALLDRFLTSIVPLTLVVPDLSGKTPAPDLMARVRAKLGMTP